MSFTPKSHVPTRGAVRDGCMQIIKMQRSFDKILVIKTLDGMWFNNYRDHEIKRRQNKSVF